MVTTIPSQRFKAIAICICSQSTKKIASMLAILPILFKTISWDLQFFLMIILSSQLWPLAAQHTSKGQQHLKLKQLQFLAYQSYHYSIQQRHYYQLLYQHWSSYPKTLFGLIFPFFFIYGTFSPTMHQLLKVVGWVYHTASSTATAYAHSCHNDDRCLQSCLSP